MKKLLFLCLFPGSAFAQTIHLNCYQENTCQYISGLGNPKTIKRTVKFCYNQDLFSFTDGSKVISFVATDYRQDIRHNHMVETFYSPGMDGLPGDYMVTIEHSKPASVSISRVTAPSWTYIINTSKVPGVFIKLSPEYLKKDSTEKAINKALHEKNVAEQKYQEWRLRHIDSLNWEYGYNERLSRNLHDSLKREQDKGNITSSQHYNLYRQLYEARKETSFDTINFPHLKAEWKDR